MAKANANLSRNRMRAPSPKRGTTRRTPLPDNFDGIRYEIGRMVRYVQDARRDPLIIDMTRQVVAQYSDFVEQYSAAQGNPVTAHNNKVLQLEGIDLWVRKNFRYLNDPSGVEVIQTPSRMARMTQIPRDVLERFMQPFYEALEEVDPSFDRRQYVPQPRMVGDCDEPCCLTLAMCAAIDIQPVAFRFGGNNGDIHHVWSRVHAGGEWWDSDVTEPSYALGDFSTFDNYEELEVEL